MASTPLPLDSKAARDDPDAVASQAPAPSSPTFSDKRTLSTETPPLPPSRRSIFCHRPPFTILLFLSGLAICGLMIANNPNFLSWARAKLAEWRANKEFRESCQKMIRLNKDHTLQVEEGEIPDPACYNLLSIRLRMFIAKHMGSPDSPFWSLGGWRSKMVICAIVSSLEFCPQIAQGRELIVMLCAFVLFGCRLYTLGLWPEIAFFDACWLFACFWVGVATCLCYFVLWMGRFKGRGRIAEKLWSPMPTMEVGGFEAWTLLVMTPTRLWMYCWFSVVLLGFMAVEKVFGVRWEFVKTLKRAWSLLIFNNYLEVNSTSSVPM